MGLLKVRMRLQGQLKSIFGFVELARRTIDISQFVSRVSVAGIELQFFLELFHRLVAIIGGASVSRTGKKRSTQSVVNTRPAGINRDHPLILVDRLDVRSLAFIGFAGGLVAPNGVGSYFGQPLDAQESRISKDLRVVVKNLGIVGIETIQIQRDLHCLAVLV